MTTYRIKDFDTFTKRDTARLVKKRLPWVGVPTRMDSRAFRRIARLPDGATVYGAFVSIVLLAGSSGNGGLLVNDKGEPWTAATLEDQIGFPEEVFTRTFEALSDPKIGWLEVVAGDSATTSAPPAQTPKPAADPVESAADPAKSAADQAPSAENSADRSNLRCTDGRTDGRDVRTGQVKSAEVTEATTSTPPPAPPPKRFTPPTLIEVQAYCVERGNRVDPEAWHNHYTANGWRVGRNAMKDWKGAVRTWERNTVARVEPGSMPWESTAAAPLEQPLRSPEHDRILPQAQAIAQRLGWAEVVKRTGLGGVGSDRQLAIVLGANVGVCEELIAGEAP